MEDHMRSLRTRLLLGGITLAAIAYASGCGDSTTPTEPTTPADVTVTIVGMNGNQSFSPNPVNVRVGQTVAWRNADSQVHTATADGGAFNTGNIAAGRTSAPITLSAAGSFAYHCIPHPTMIGTVVVQ
jgi:plastocyanin